MQLIVSQLPAQGIFISRMKELPGELGVELTFEAANDFFWNHNLPSLLAGRTGPVSVHGPFCGFNLADTNADWECIFENYRSCFSFCEKISAIHCVCHPDAAMTHEQMSGRQFSLELAIERLLKLQAESEKYGIRLLIENLPEKYSLFRQEVFLGRMLDNPDFHFLLDTGHAIISGWNLPEYMAKISERLGAFHLHEPSNGRDVHLPVGSGMYDWTDFFEAYRKYTPDAPIVLEYEEANVETIIKSICFLEKL